MSAAHLEDVSTLPDLFGTADPAPSPDNADPHPVILTVLPREWRVPFAREFEAEYEIDVEHPAACSGVVEECPVADYLETVGIDDDIYAGFPDPDDLSDGDLAALDGTVRWVTITRHFSRSDGPNGTEYDVDYYFTWSDQ